MTRPAGRATRRRVVSLVPSVTETLRAWGHDPIACTRFCEQPELVHVGGTKDPDVAAIVALRPDLVVIDEEENRRDDADALEASGVALFVTAVRAVADVAPTLERLAEAIGCATYSADSMALPPPVRTTHVTAFVPIWRRPWMTINGETYGASVLAHVGIATFFAAHDDRYPALESLEGIDADEVLAPSEPFPFSERHRAELERAGPVTFVDGKDLFWWGVRTPAAIARLSREW